MPRTPVVIDGLVAEWVGKRAKNGTDPGNNTDPTNDWKPSLGAYDSSYPYNIDFVGGEGWVGDGSQSNPYAFYVDGDTPGANHFWGWNIGNTTTLFTASYTWELWYWIDDYAGTWMDGLMEFGNYLNSGFRVGISPSGYIYYWNTQNGGGLDLATAYTLVPKSRWVQLAFTHNSGDNQYYSYVNGTQENLGTTGSYVAPTQPTCALFLPFDCGTGYITGKVATARAYNRVLSSTEIAQNRAAGPDVSYLDNWKGLEVVRLVNG